MNRENREWLSLMRSFLICDLDGDQMRAQWDASLPPDGWSGFVLAVEFAEEGAFGETFDVGFGILLPASRQRGH